MILLEETERKMNNTLIAETERFELAIREQKKLLDSELCLKEKEVLKLNDLIAEWVLKYMVLGREHGHEECSDVKSLL